MAGLGDVELEAWLAALQRKDLLRFIACGSVDDGKSTLIGRLLHESKAVFEDQLAALAADSRKFGTRGGELDYALLLDGLMAEREQGITIDVAYRFFETPRRRFIVADAPGHEQYTRNMATAASTADLAIILVDARKGVLPQTRRHSYIACLMGVKLVVLAINKMDLAGYSAERFARIEAEYREFARRIGIADVTCLPTCAVHGDNVVERGANMPWYRGPTLIEHLETVPVADARAGAPFRMPVQWVNRPNADFRGLAGTVASGSIAPGDRVRLVPSGRETRVARIVTADGDLERAAVDQAVTITLADELDVSRGDVLCAPGEPAEAADQFEATLVWMGNEPLLPGRAYLLKLGPAMATATVAPLKYKVDLSTLDHMAATRLELNEIGVCQLELDRLVAFEPYERNRDLGGFILIDRVSNATVAAGMLRFALRRSHNVHWQATDVSRASRAAMKAQTPCVLWFTGIPASGKSTIANLLEKRLHAMGRHTYLLDGDNLRHGLNKDLGFTPEARVENIRRAAEVARLMTDAGLVVIAAFISPFRSERRMARALFAQGEFLEVFVDAPVEVAETRDPKGLWAKARSGALRNFTGVDSPYEPPENAEVQIRTAEIAPDAAVELILQEMRRRGL